MVAKAEVVVPAAGAFAETLDWLGERLGFRVAAVHPADDPRTVVLTGHGLRLRLEREATGEPGPILLRAEDPEALVGRLGAAQLRAPNGTRFEIVAAAPPVELPPLRPELIVSKRPGDAASWGAGRAGMRYRDLIPGRLGGRFIASHIRIDEAGPVPDYVHWHAVRLQMIHCVRGWVRVVYEDQGPAFVLEAGDCVLQPPRIRHRVLECSAGLEVVEISSPADHWTFADPRLELPNDALAPTREFSGQRFVRQRASEASWEPATLEGFEARDTGLAAATRGLLDARVLRARGRVDPRLRSHDDELAFSFVLAGEARLHLDARDPVTLEPGDAVVVPAGLGHALEPRGEGLELLAVRVPRAREPGPGRPEAAAKPPCA